MGVDKLLELNGLIARSGRKKYQIARQLGISPVKLSNILHGSIAPPPGFETSIMEVLGVYPESNVSSVSDILLREIAGSIGIITAGLTKDEVENRIISELIPDFPKKKIVLSTGEVRKALLDAAIEIFNKQYKGVST